MDKILTNRNLLLTLASLFLFTLFIGNSTFSLWDRGEAADAQLGQNIVQGGDWTAPSGTWSDMHGKPPLHFWSLAVSYQLFGVNESSTRLPSVLSTLLTFIALFFLGKQIFDERTATLACMVLGSTFLVPTLGKIGVTDAGLLLFETVAMFSLYLQWQRPDWRWLLLLWLSVGLGTLQKGMAILVLVGGVGLVLLLLSKDKKQTLRRFAPWWGVVATLPTLIWSYSIWQKDENFVRWLVDFYLLQPTAGDTVSAWVQPFGYHFLLLLGAFLMWIAFLPNVLLDTFRKAQKKDEKALFFVAWWVFGWLFWELIPSSLPSYALAVHPTFALLIAQEFLRYEAACNRFHNQPIDQHLTVRAKKANFNQENLIKTTHLLALIAIFFIAMGLTMGGWYYLQGTGLRRGGGVGMVLWATSVLAAIGFYSRNAKTVFYNATFGGLLFLLFTWWLLLPIAEPARSLPKRTAQAAQTLAGTATPVLLAASNKANLPSLPFYLNQHFKQISTEQDLLLLQKICSSGQPLVLILDDDFYNALRPTLEQLKTPPKMKQENGFILDKGKSGNFYILYF